MSKALRHRRMLFLSFLAAVFFAVMAWLPTVTAQTADQKSDATQPGSAAGATQPGAVSSGPAKPAAEHPGFEQADRNKDGAVDKSESGVVPGLSANFERADRNKDGKLDKDEFARGLQILQVRR